MTRPCSAPRTHRQARFARPARPIGTVLLFLLLSGLMLAPAHALGTRAGYEVAFQAESPHPYPAGVGNVPSWSTTVEHVDATYIALHFGRFELSPGDRVVIRSKDGRQRHVLTERGRHGLGTFWAPHIKGDHAVIELFSPGRRERGWGVLIDRYAAGLAEPDTAADPEAVCGLDDRFNAICYQATEPGAYNLSRAVARLLINGQFWCTGWLVGCNGDLMTNNHCIDDPALPDPATAALNTDYEFLAEAPTCGSSNTIQGGHAGPIWGGTPSLIQRDLALDYAYINLTGNPQSTYGSFVVDNRSPVANERIYIPQHSGGRAKELGLQSSAASDESGFCEVTVAQSGILCTGGPGDVTYECDSEGGSSGSPVVAYSGQSVIALHHCSLGASLCPNLGVPITAIITDLGANLPACAIANSVTDIVVDSQTITDLPFGNGNGFAEPVEIIDYQIDLRNLGNTLATNVSAVLSTTTPGITIIDDTASWPDIGGFGAEASLAPHFKFEVADTVPCSTLIDFDLAISTSQGAFNASIPQIVGDPGPTAAATKSAAVAIPDNDPTGITSNLALLNSIIMADIIVSVDISHTRIGDLVVELTSPGGTTVRLHNQTGGSADDIVTTYDTLTLSDGPGSMADFIGESAQGIWDLKVSDLQNQQTGTLNSWSLFARQSTTATCSPVPCEVTAVVSATPDTVCPGESVLLADAGSSVFGDDCSGTLEFQFNQGLTILQDYSTDPDFEAMPLASDFYLIRVRDTGSMAVGSEVVPVTVLPSPSPVPTQTPNPMCDEFPGAVLEAGAGFLSYEWKDDLDQVVGTSQTLAVDETACGRTYSISVTDGGTCPGIEFIEVVCQACTPPEVSPAGAIVPFRMGLNGNDTIEFELLPSPTAIYHLYQVDNLTSMLAGDWSIKFCDLASQPGSTWNPIDAVTVQWTPTGLPSEGYWVVVAEDSGLEGPFGVMTGGSPRPADPDESGSFFNIGCP